MPAEINIITEIGNNARNSRSVSGPEGQLISPVLPVFVPNVFCNSGTEIDDASPSWSGKNRGE